MSSFRHSKHTRRKRCMSCSMRYCSAAISVVSGVLLFPSECHPLRAVALPFVSGILLVLPTCISLYSGRTVLSEEVEDVLRRPLQLFRTCLSVYPQCKRNVRRSDAAVHIYIPHTLCPSHNLSDSPHLFVCFLYIIWFHNCPFSLVDYILHN